MLRRIADNHHVKRNEIIGQRERCANRLAAILGRIGTRPYGTEPHSVSRKQKILRCCRRILNPEVASAAFNRLIHIAADNDSERSLEQHLRIRIGTRNIVEHCLLLRLRLDAVLHARHQAHTKHHNDYSEHYVQND